MIELAELNKREINNDSVIRYKDYIGRVTVTRNSYFYLSNANGGPNDYIFHLLGIDRPYEFCLKKGLHPRQGNFPELLAKEFLDLLEILKELAKIDNGNYYSLFINLINLSQKEVVEVQTYLEKFKGRINYEFGDCREDNTGH